MFLSVFLITCLSRVMYCHDHSGIRHTHADPSGSLSLVPTEIPAVHEVCTDDAECPPASRCRPTSCDGYTCLCDDGFVASNDRSQCLKAVRINERCDQNTTRCISEYAECMSGTCQCLKGFLPTKDGRCKMPGINFVGETCGECEFPAQCIDGECKCAGDFRSLSTEEFWVDPISVLQCRPRHYSLDSCNGTSILRTPTTASSAVGADVTIPISPTINSNDWSRILPEKSIYDKCNAHSQCPGNARCRPNSCDGFLCVCNPGYVSTDDRLQCRPSVKTGDACDPRTDQCLSPFAACIMGICKCQHFFSPTIDGRCRITKDKYVGENCRGTEECEYPGTCVDGKCACVLPQRKLSEEEFWIDPTLTIQCRPKDYSLWRCNHTVIDIPAQFQKEIPIDVEIDLTYQKAAHNGVDHADHVEINPTIVVEEPKPDDDVIVPLHIAGILAAALFALLIACIFKTRRRKAIKRDISLTRTNIIANKNILPDEEIINANSIPLEHTMSLPPAPAPVGSPSNVHIPRPNVAIYDKHGWHTLSDSFGDAKSLYDNNADMYSDSTTRSTGPFIIDSHKNVHNLSGGSGTINPHISSYALEALKHNNSMRMEHNNSMRMVPYVVDGQRGGQHVDQSTRNQGSLYANECWQTDCNAEHDIDLVMF